MSSFHSWLPVALPAGAHRVRTADPDLASVLAEAGAELVDVRPDVAIGARLAELGDDAAHVILSLGSNQPDGGSRILRARRRLTRSVAVRARARAARVTLRRRGYRRVSVLLWDYDQPIQIPGRGAHRRSIAELLPERALVVARRGDAPAGTLLGAVMDEAAALVGEPVDADWPQVRAGVLVIVAETAVLRLAVGPAGQRLGAQRRALEQLCRADAPAVVRDRLPWPVRHGRLGLCEWSLEPRLAGEIVTVVPEGLEWQCMEFLAALHVVDAGGPRRSLVEDARRCAAVCPDPTQGRELVALGRDLEARLAGVARGFGHGDFWTRNLLCVDGRLVGVIDWDGAGPGRLPLLDLIHYQVSAVREGGHMTLGDALIASQLDRAGDAIDPVTRAYCERIGLELDPATRQALALAFWIDRNALELELRPDIVTPQWVVDNVLVVLDHLRGRGMLPDADIPV